MAGREVANIHVDCLQADDPLYRMVFQATQRTHRPPKWTIAELFEERGSALGILDEAELAQTHAAKGLLLMAKPFRLNQVPGRRHGERH
ncbi:hypothetical protein QWY76_08160 [Halomonas maura]|nr:hypothetical protein [Halomonas maura]MDN3555946.1 hypothetical protein [Halomonas maura]